MNAEFFERVFTQEVGARYLVEIPAGEGPFPVLLFLHGLGERGEDLEIVKRHGVPKEIAAGRKLPFLVVAPQLPENRTYWHTNTLLSLLDEIGEHYPVDSNRVYVTGISMGGYGSWALACAAPKRFAAIAPICGGGIYLAALSLASLPIWAIHGDADAAVPLSESQIMIEAVRRAGGNPRFTVVPGGGHDIWTDVYAGEEIYEWLLSHSRA